MVLSAAAVIMTSCSSPDVMQDKTIRRPKPPRKAATNTITGIVITPGDSLHKIYHEGRERYFLLHTPPSASATNPIPVLLALHGGGGTPEGMVEMSGFNALADRYHFAVVYPSGSGSTPNRLFWNILLSQTYASENNIDDIGYLQLVLDDVGHRVFIDKSRIYASGFSQGGMMCYRLACDANFSKQLAAIAVVGATMTVAPDACEASRPVPLISFHGVRDPFSNFKGGIAENAPRNDQVARPSVAESIGYWVSRGALPKQPEASGTRGTAEMSQFGPDSNDYVVVSWVIRDGGHTWPGSNGNLPEWIMGKVNLDIDATVLIWDFLSQHPLKDAH